MNSDVIMSSLVMPAIISMTRKIWFNKGKASEKSNGMNSTSTHEMRKVKGVREIRYYLLGMQ
jgi:hypothetical protein